jgi:hypothetical protein
MVKVHGIEGTDLHVLLVFISLGVLVIWTPTPRKKLLAHLELRLKWRLQLRRMQ